MEELSREGSELVHAISVILKRIDKAPNDDALKVEHNKLVDELAQVHAAIQDEDKRIVAVVKSEHGITEADWDAYEKSLRPPTGSEYWNSDIQRVPTTTNLDELVAHGLAVLTPLVDLEWLRAQRKLAYRPSYGEADSKDYRLHLVGRHRLLPPDAPPRPQRFAQMLLVSEDQVNKRNDIDLFDGPMLVSEVAALGVSIEQILHQLGPEAVRKLNSLPSLPNTEVASTVHELLVGAASVRAGLKVEMLPASKAEKTPDYRVHDQPVPWVLECKRRIGLSEYAETEARHIEHLYAALEPIFRRWCRAIEVEFSVEVFSVSREEFLLAIEPLCESQDDDVTHKTSWGTVRVERLPLVSKCTQTRLFSPLFLHEVFGWDHVESEWDGLLCEIDPTPSAVVTSVRSPRCLKWKCNAATSELKKARSVSSLWNDAIKQIPAGEVGGVYIAYEEKMRGQLADARTAELLKDINERKWWHRHTIRVPWTVVARLYPQAHGHGGLELIESTIPMYQDGLDHLVGTFPDRVFTVRPPE